MKKNNKTVKSLIFSAIGLLLCIVMLTGTTFAWLTQSATTGENTITTAGFNANLQWSEDFTTWNELTHDVSQLYTVTGLRPSQSTAVRYVKIHNGNDYSVHATISMGNVAFKDADDNPVAATELVMYYAVVDAATTADALEVAANEHAIENGDWVTNEVLDTGDDLIIALVFKLPDSAENAGITTSFKLTAVAAQYN